VCPQCGSIARDRFLLWSYVARTPPGLRSRVLETSPRLGTEYRRAMAHWFDYTCSDFDERAHAGTVRLDLQAIDLPDASLDVLLTPHVLEHVPETDRALAEIARVLAPGGRMYLQVPVLQGATAPPTEPEFHGDDTPVFWRFGPDLTARLREHGFTTALLCTAEWKRRVGAGATEWGTPTSKEFDVTSLLAGSIAADLEVIADDEAARRLGFEPAFMFLTWEAIRPL
jgi:SAM-dependent methyltransferase